MATTTRAQLTRFCDMEDRFHERTQQAFADLQKRFEEAVVAATGKKIDFAKVKAKFPALQAQVLTEWRPRADRLSKRRGNQQKRLDNLRFALCHQFPIKPGARWNEFTRVSSGDYRSQGWGATRYAKGSAESSQADLEACGIKGRVDRTERVYPCTPTKYNGMQSSHTDYLFTVFAKADKLTIYAIQHGGHGMPVDKLVQWQWAHGLNPRVLNPFLPHDLAEAWRKESTAQAV